MYTSYKNKNKKITDNRKIQKKSYFIIMGSPLKNKTKENNNEKQFTFLYVFSLLLLLDPLTPFSLADDIYMKQ